MDLQTVLKNTSEEIAKEKQAIAEQIEANRIVAEENKAQAKILREIKEDLDKREKAIKSVEDVIAYKKEVDQKAAELNALDLELKREDLRLKKYENSLAVIKAEQDAREEKLIAQGTAQAEREKNYQEELQKNFVQNFMSKLLLK